MKFEDFIKSGKSVLNKLNIKPKSKWIKWTPQVRNQLSNKANQNILDDLIKKVEAKGIQVNDELYAECFGCDLRNVIKITVEQKIDELESILNFKETEKVIDNANKVEPKQDNTNPLTNTNNMANNNDNDLNMKNEDDPTKYKSYLTRIKEKGMTIEEYNKSITKLDEDLSYNSVLKELKNAESDLKKHHQMLSDYQIKIDKLNYTLNNNPKTIESFVAQVYSTIKKLEDNWNAFVERVKLDPESKMYPLSHHIDYRSEVNKRSQFTAPDGMVRLRKGKDLDELWIAYDKDGIQCQTRDDKLERELAEYTRKQLCKDAGVLTDEERSEMWKTYNKLKIYDSEAANAFWRKNKEQMGEHKRFITVDMQSYDK